MSVRLRLAGMGVVLVVAAMFAVARGHAWHWLVCAALGFSWVGDAMLLRFPPVAGEVRDPFLVGMGSFALAQITYIVAFAWALSGMRSLHVPTPGALLGTDLLGALLPIYLLLGVLFWVLTVFRTEQPPVMKIAVLVYGALLCTMAAFACAAAFTGIGIVWPLILGGALFIVSDGLIAAHLFQGKIINEKRYEIIVWATYVPAQIFLLLGASMLY